MARVLFFGSDEVSLPALRALRLATVHTPTVASRVAVVVPRARGEGTAPGPVQRYAEAEGLELLQPQLSRWRPEKGAWDVAAVASFGRLVPQAVLQQLPLGGLNMHPSLLPYYRGAAPLPYQVLCGETAGAVSVIELHPHRFDEGRILLRWPFPITHGTTQPSLRTSAASLGARALLHALGALEDLRSCSTAQVEPQGIVRAHPLESSPIAPLLQCDGAEELERALEEELGPHGLDVAQEIPLQPLPLTHVPPIVAFLEARALARERAKAEGKSTVLSGTKRGREEGSAKESASQGEKSTSTVVNASEGVTGGIGMGWQRPMHTRKLPAGCGAVDWAQHSRESLLCHWRGLEGVGGSHTFLQVGKRVLRVNLLSISPAPALDGLPTDDALPGRLLWHASSRKLLAKVGRGGWVELCMLQVAGKRRQEAAAFSNGYRIAATTAHFLSEPPHP